MPFLDHNYSNLAVPTRDLKDDEAYVLSRYEEHASTCERCVDALDTYREGHSLCKTGIVLARDVANYLFNKDGKVYSTVDKEHHHEVLVRIHRQHKATRRLLRAIEEGLRLRRREQQQPIISYDRNYHVAPREPAQQQVTEIIERSPRPHRRTITIYRTRAPSRSSPRRGSLYEVDRFERHQSVRNIRRMDENA